MRFAASPANNFDIARYGLPLLPCFLFAALLQANEIHYARLTNNHKAEMLSVTSQDGHCNHNRRHVVHEGNHRNSGNAAAMQQIAMPIIIANISCEGVLQ